MMIISKTPLRISFFSGGSDIRGFYEKEPGAALSCTINKFIYVVVNHTPYTGIRMMHDQVEDTDGADGIKNIIAREALKRFNVSEEITIASIADVRAHGAGLGSSSAFTVGLVNALSYGIDRRMGPFEMAEAACEIEIDRCGYPIGKQDQYAAAVGGFNLFEFERDGNVNVVSSDAMHQNAKELERRLLLVYSGKSRNAADILHRQVKEASDDPKKLERVMKNRNRAYEAKEFLEAGDYDAFGNLLDIAWADKKKIVSGMSGEFFNDVYDRAKKAGAIGGKLLGAGGGGFFVFYVPTDKKPVVQRAVTKHLACRVYDFEFHYTGSDVSCI